MNEQQISSTKGGTRGGTLHQRAIAFVDSQHRMHMAVALHRACRPQGNGSGAAAGAKARPWREEADDEEEEGDSAAAAGAAATRSKGDSDSEAELPVRQPS